MFYLHSAKFLRLYTLMLFRFGLFDNFEFVKFRIFQSYFYGCEETISRVQGASKKVSFQSMHFEIKAPFAKIAAKILIIKANLFKLYKRFLW